VKARRKKKRPGLMLTSLLDMFTIILIFLIVSFEAEDYDFKLNTDLTLPESAAKAHLKPAANVAITQTGVIIQGEVVVPLVNGKPRPEDVERADEQMGVEIMPKLVEALTNVLAARLVVADNLKQMQDAPPDPEAEPEEQNIIMLQADKGLEYRTIYMVMRSAAVAEVDDVRFDKYRLTVMKK
jgi:biopolymer transport protein ExbD